MSISLMQKVLGDDWHKLPDVIRKHYQLIGEEQSRLEGVMEIGYPKYLCPIVWLIHLFGGLVLWTGDQVHAQVDKTSEAGGDVLHWRRTMTYPDGKIDYFRSEMHYSADRELIETIGFGFGLLLTVEVRDGDLLYRSKGHFWQCGSYRLNIPD